MAVLKASTAARKIPSARYAAWLCLLVFTAIGVMVWGNEIRNIAILGIAWVAVVGFACLFSMKYLGLKLVRNPERDRKGNQEAPPS
ncbi:MAG TPA: hypothetical protein VFU42_08655 [Candidatus Deferrimicrobiaceae bacterium]|nr:hypothetical protein [Candidatus Deferrimicrobiaceae bacterium]